MKKIIHLSLAFTVACLASCVSTKSVRLDPSDAAKLRGAKLTTTRHVAPKFSDMTAGSVATGALFGGVGAAIAAQSMNAAGGKIIQENSIPDPAELISKELAKALTSAHGCKITSRTSSGINIEKPADIAAANSGSDYVLYVRTLNWSSVYFPANWSHYRVIYGVKLLLIETKSGKVVAEGSYSRVPKKTANSPTRNELMANGASRLKRELKISAAGAIAHFKKEVLAL